MGLNGSLKKKANQAKKGSSWDRDTSVDQLTSRRMWIPQYSTMLKNHFTSERHVDDLLVGVPQLRARNCKWTNAACDLSPGRPGTTSEADIKRLDGTGKNTRCRIERMRVEGQQRKRDGINNETFIKRGGGNVAYSVLHMQTVNAAIVVCGT